MPKAYRPIALQNTVGKIMEAVVADRLTALLEAEGALPAKHFGGRRLRAEGAPEPVGRSNTLRFDDYTSRTQFKVSTWPLSVILYLVYSAELWVGEDLMGRRDTILGYVDDTAYVVVGDSIAQNAEKLKAVAE
ncbi:hypothetical protein FB107DRAFT_280083 [Schizophyllum commune]